MVNLLCTRDGDGKGTDAVYGEGIAKQNNSQSLARRQTIIVL